MLRSVTVGVALSVLAAACALTTQAPPANTRMIQAHVRNTTVRPVELTITTLAGVLPGAVQPLSTVPAGTTTELILYVPLGGDWALATNGNDRFTNTDVELDPDLRRGCRLNLWLLDDGLSLGCLKTP